MKNWRREFQTELLRIQGVDDPVTVRQRVQYKPTVRMFAIPQTPLFEFLDNV
jgi:hypothetical protein